jgi:hypothetical protein
LSGYLKSRPTDVATELPAKRENFLTLSSPSALTYGPIQWDGSYITVELGRSLRKKEPVTIYQLSVSGSSVSVAGEVYLNTHGGTEQYSWIQGTLVAKGYNNTAKNNRIGLWHYPQGGSRPYIVLKGFEYVFYLTGTR